MSAFHYSANALGIAGILLSLRLQVLAGPGFVDRLEQAKANLGKYRDSPAALNAVIAMSLMFLLQSACFILSFIVSDIWPKTLFLIPVTAWLALCLGVWSLSLHRPHVTVLKRVEQNYLRASVGLNFVLAVAITHFYRLM